MKKGFTLIELLVVVAIIGMLSSVVLSSLNTARGNARDARRAQDMGQIINSLELYYNANNRYPAHTADGGCSGGNGQFCIENLNNDLAPTYIPSVPVDPLHGSTYGNGYLYYSEGNIYNLLRWSESSNSWCHPPESAPATAWNNHPACPS